MTPIIAPTRSDAAHPADTAYPSDQEPIEKALSMTTTMTNTATNKTDTDIAISGSAETNAHRTTFLGITRSEWMKFRTVRSNKIALAGSMVAAITFGALFSSLAGSDEGPNSLADNALSLSLGGFQLSQIVIAILGVSLVASEYQTGLIRTWFSAAPDRIRVLLAKVGVFGSLVFGVSLVGAVLSFLAGQALLPDTFTALSLGSEGVSQALFGTAFYMACIGLIGIGLGFLLRSTAAGAGAIVTMLMIAPVMVNLLPSSLSDSIGKILPSNAGSAVQGSQSTTELLSAGWGAAVLIGWVLLIVGSAAVSLKRRDA